MTRIDALLPQEPESQVAHDDNLDTIEATPELAGYTVDTSPNLTADAIKVLSEYRTHLDRHGDISDTLHRDGNPKTLPRYVGKIAVVMGALTPVGLEIGSFGAASFCGIAPGIVMATEALEHRLRNRWKNDVERAYVPHEPAVDVLGKAFNDEHVQVLQTKGSGKQPSQRVVVWEGAVNPDHETSAYLHGRLGKLQRVSEVLGADRIAIPASYVSRVRGHEVPEDHMQKIDDWVDERKPGRISVKVADDTGSVVLASDAELKNLVYAARQQMLIERDRDIGLDLEQAMGVLATIRPQHHTLQWFKRRDAEPELADAKMKQVLRSALERNLDDVTSKKQLDDELNPLREKVHLSGGLNGVETVVWRNQATKAVESSSNVLDEYAIDRQRLKSIIDNPQSFPEPLVVKACELAAWLALHNEDQDAPRTEQDNTTDVPQATLTINARESIVGEVSLWREKDGKSAEVFSMSTSHRTKIGRAYLALAMGVSMFIGSYHAHDTIQGYKASVAELDATVDEKHEMLQKLITSNPTTNTYHVVTTPLRAFADARSSSDGADVDPMAPEKCATTDDGRCIDGAGNVTEAHNPNKPEWTVISRNGMNAEGYWGMYAHYELAAGRLAWLRPEGPNHGTDEARNKLVEERLPVLPSPSLESTADDMPSLHVSKVLALSKDNTENLQPFSNKYHLITVPRLEGTQISAAKLSNGMPVRLGMQTNGQAGLIVPIAETPEEARLEYQLIPKIDPDVAELSALMGGIAYDRPEDGVWWEDELKMRKVQQTVDDAWHAHGVATDAQTGNYDTDDTTGVQAQVDHMQQNFNYRLQPLDDPNVVNRPEEFARTVLDNKEANCNVANTLLAVGNRMRLNYATGFLNTQVYTRDGRTESYLSSHEKHAWTVDQNGTRFDATPSKGMLEHEKAYFDESFAQDEGAESPSFPWGEAAGGVLAIAGTVAAVRNRRRLARPARTLRRKINNKQLQKVDDDTWLQAGQAVEQILYMPDNERIVKWRPNDSMTPEAARETVARMAALPRSRRRALMRKFPAGDNAHPGLKQEVRHLVNTTAKAHAGADSDEVLHTPGNTSAQRAEQSAATKAQVDADEPFRKAAKAATGFVGSPLIVTK